MDNFKVTKSFLSVLKTAHTIIVKTEYGRDYLVIYDNNNVSKSEFIEKTENKNINNACGEIYDHNTIALLNSLLKENDELYIKWDCDGHMNDIARKAGVYIEICNIHIMRTSGKKYKSFVVTGCFCVTNNNYRMINKKSKEQIQLEAENWLKEHEQQKQQQVI